MLPAASVAMPRKTEAPRSWLIPMALTGIVFLAVGFAAGYGIASWGSAGAQVEPAPIAELPQRLTPRESVAPPPPPVVAEVATTAAAPSPQGVSETPAAVERAEPAVVQPRAAVAEPPAPPPAPPVRGRLIVRSTPAGARVFVDGRERGRTPLTLGSLSPGSYAIRVARDGYVPIERRLTVSASRPRSRSTSRWPPSAHQRVRRLPARRVCRSSRGRPAPASTSTGVSSGARRSACATWGPASMPCPSNSPATADGPHRFVSWLENGSGWPPRSS